MLRNCSNEAENMHEGFTQWFNNEDEVSWQRHMWGQFTLLHIRRTCQSQGLPYQVLWYTDIQVTCLCLPPPS